MTPLTGLATAPFQQTIALKLAKLDAAQVHTDFEFTPHRTLNARYRDAQQESDGKVERVIISVFGTVRQVWHGADGRRLASRKTGQTELQFMLATGISTADGSQFTCTSCGHPISDPNADVFTCPACGALMHREDYRELLTGLNTFPASQARAQARKALQITVSASTVLAIAGLGVQFFAGGIDELVARILGLLPPEVGRFVPLLPLLLLLLAPQALRLFNSWSNRRDRRREEQAALEAANQRAIEQRAEQRAEFAEIDPLFSEALVLSELVLLFKACWLTPANAPSDVWGVYTHPEQRAKLQALAAADAPIVDLVINEALFFEVASDLDAQRVRCWLDYEVLRPSGRSLEFQRHQVAVTLIRNATGRTVLVEGRARCASCNAPADASTQPVCPDCGADLKRDALHWRLYDIEPATERPERIFTPRGGIASTGAFVGWGAAAMAPALPKTGVEGQGAWLLLGAVVGVGLAAARARR